MGDTTTLAGITLDDLVEFQTGYLSPDQLVLAVVGNVPRDELLEATRATLGTLRPVARTVPEPGAPPLTRESLSEEVDGGGNQSSLRMARVVDLDPLDRWALVVGVRILSDRMAQDLRETRGLAYSLGISVDFQGGRAVLSASMGTRPENIGEAEVGMLSYFNAGELRADPEEIETATNKYISRMRMRRVTSLGKAFTLSRDLFMTGDVEYADKETLGLESVTPQDVNRAIGRYLVGGPMITVIAR